jgi:hypothetical protein
MPFAIKPEGGYVRITLSGNLTVSEVNEAAKELDRVDAGQGRSLHRLVEIAGVEGLDLNFASINKFQSARNKVKLLNHVRTAVVSKSKVQYGIARMFQLLNSQPQTEVGVFKDNDSAKKWLLEEN